MIEETNILYKIHFLKNYAEKSDWQNVSFELCHQVLMKIVEDGPSKDSWLALMELLGVWPVATEVQAWVQQIEVQVTAWPWQLRKVFLGGLATRGDKNIVYRLVGQLEISHIEDLFGWKFQQWSQYENWKNLRGLQLFKIESWAKCLKPLTTSPFLQELQLLKFTVVDDLRGNLDVLFSDGVLPHLRELGLISAMLDSKDIDVLSQTSLAQHISSLDLSSNFLKLEDLSKILKAGAFPNLKTLDLSYNDGISAKYLKTEIADAAHPLLEKVIIEGTPAAKSLRVKEILSSDL